MDPLANIQEQRVIAARIVASDPQWVEEPAARQASRDDADRLAELVLALDEWRKGGGFDPYASEAEAQ